MVRLQELNKSQLVKLLDAINCEGIDNQFWAVNSYVYSWNAAKVFGGANQTEFEPGRYIKVMYDDEKPVSFYFYTKTRIMAFIQHENETLEVAWEMQEITQQKPVLCLESYTH